MSNQLKRRDISGIFIFDTFPGEEKRQPTCVEDCQQTTRREWCESKSSEYLFETIKILVQSWKELIDYLINEKCFTEERKEALYQLGDGCVFRSKSYINVRKDFIIEEIDFISEKIRFLADWCGVTKHKEDDVECDDQGSHS